VLTAGATFQPGGKLKPKVSESILSADQLGYQTTLFSSAMESNFAMPSTLAAGIFFHTMKLGAGADYTFQDWGDKNKGDDATDHVKFVNTNSIRIGAQYTPDRNDVRYMLRRWTYRAGLRYNTYYLQIDGRRIDDKAITFGVGFPLRRGSLSDLNLGLEYGQRGTTQNGLTRENYFKISIGLNLFGTDDWFVKRKYN